LSNFTQQRLQTYLQNKNLSAFRIKTGKKNIYAEDDSGNRITALKEKNLQLQARLFFKEQLQNFRFCRQLYHDSKYRHLVLDSLVSTKKKIKQELEKQYGPFSYSYYESAFDEYLVSIQKKYSIELKDELVLKHAGLTTLQELQEKGYRDKMKYVNDMVDHQQREKMIIKSGGPSYKKWLKQEIAYFLRNPARLITELNLVFENLLFTTVSVHPGKFMHLYSKLDLNEQIKILYGKKAAAEKIDNIIFIKLQPVEKT